MIAFDDVAPSFRRARERWPLAPALVAHYATIVEAYNGTGQSLIEGAKSFVESVCRTILRDFGRPDPGDVSTTKILVATMETLGIRNTRGASKFDKVLSAHNTLADALTECRNQDGALAHGKDGYLDALGSHHVRMYLLTVDTILSLVLGALDYTEPCLEHTREPHQRFARLNAAIDEAASVDALIEDESGLLVLTIATESLPEGLTIRVEPSKLLYYVDRAAYIEVLKSLPQPEHGIQIDAEAVATIGPDFARSASEGAPNVHITDYAGPLDSLLSPLQVELKSIGVKVHGSVATHLAPSLLYTFAANAGLDWAIRPNLRSKVLVAFKRILRTPELRQPRADVMSEALVGWFATKAPANSEASRKVVTQGIADLAPPASRKTGGPA